MKSFVTKIALFLTPLLALTLMFVGAVQYASHKLQNSVLDNSMESKIKALYSPEEAPSIIIMGDSRAERQLDPRVFEAELGINTINVANSSGDLPTVLAAIMKYQLDQAENIIIISASVFQVNDSAVDRGYLSEKQFQKMSLTERLQLYRSNFSELLRLSVRLIKNSMKSSPKLRPYNSQVIEQLGFNAIEGQLNSESIPSDWNMKTTRHSWYKGTELQNVRWKIFKSSVEELSNLNAKVIIYNGPASPSWIQKTQNTYVGQVDRDYAKNLANLFSQYDNIQFYDFYSDISLGLTDEDYYDPLHLNKLGAEKFSRYFIRLISQK